MESKSLKDSFSGNKWLYLGALIVTVVIVYYPGLSGSFFFDDQTNIVNNPSLRLFDGSLASLAAASTGGIASPLGRPLSMMSFALNFHFFGDHPFSFKLINLLIHLSNGVLIFILARQLRSLLGDEDKAGGRAAIWVAAVWLLHPINLSPALFVVQRMTSLASFFTLLALCLYIYGRKAQGIARGRSAIAASLLICWPLAILCKETGLLLPLYILVCEWLIFHTFDLISRRKIQLLAAVFGLALVILTIMNWQVVAAGYRFRDFGMLERLLTESRVLWFYLLQMALPLPDFFGLYHDDVAISRNLLSPPSTLFAIFGWIFVIVLAIRKRRQAPEFSFAVMWFLAAHMLESTFLPLEIAYEHRNYLASFGIFFGLTRLLVTSTRQDNGNLAKMISVAGFVVFCGVITMLRAAQWGNEYQRTQAEAAAHPNSPRANYEAGVALMSRTFDIGKGSDMAYQMTRAYFKRAADLDRNGRAQIMGLLYLDCVAHAKKNIDLQVLLRERFTKGRFLPGDEGIIHSLSSLLVEKRLCLDDAEVKALIDAGLSNPAANGRIRGMLNTVGMDYSIAKIGSLPLAIDYARAAIRSDPNNVSLHINLAHLLLAAGNIEESLQEYNALSMLRPSPNDLAAIENLGQKISNAKKNANKP